MLLIGAITLAPLALLPPMLQHLYGYSVIDTGMVLAPRGAGVLITMFISSQFAGKIDLRFVIATGMLIISYSLWEMAHWSLDVRSEEHTSELQSLMRISYAVFCLKKNINKRLIHH